MYNHDTPVAVALLYQTSQLGGHLREALKDFGAAVVYEALAAEIDRDALESSGARVVVINLDANTDAQADAHIDHVYEVLDTGDYEVVFNDAQVSSQLQGWDHARWARHLAAKIMHKPEIAVPARPAGAQAVPTPVQKSAADVPTADRPGESVAEAESAMASSEDVANLDFATPLQQFANQDMAIAYQAQPETTPDFAAELEALFAETGQTSTPSYAAIPDLELPETEPEPTPAVDHLSSAFDSGTQELNVEFPALFDQLDQAAAEVPVATDSTYKPAALPVTATSMQEIAATEPLLPADWLLEPLDEFAANPSMPAAEPPMEQTIGVQKISAQEFLAPEVEISATQHPVLENVEFELMPLDEAIAPQPYQSPAHENEIWLDDNHPVKKLAIDTNIIKRVCVLGASIGGPEAVREFLGALPVSIPVLFLLAQHMSEEFLDLMSVQLAKATPLTVRNPTHGEHAGHGEVLVVPTTHRLQVDAEGVITLEHLPDRPPYSPSIDLVLRDAADRFGAQTSAIIFSGMAHDAIEGGRYLKDKGGMIWAQDPGTCVISSMVDNAKAAGIVSFVGSPLQLAEKMIAEYGKV